MVNLEQIKTLEAKVEGAVSLIIDLRSENDELKEKLNQYETRISELEGLINSFKEDQTEIEKGIISALDHLDLLSEESQTTQTTVESPAPAVEEDFSTNESAEETVQEDAASNHTPAESYTENNDSENLESEDSSEEYDDPNQLDIF